MIGKAFVAVALIFGVMILGVAVERLYRAFAARNPQLGPFRKEGGGCGNCSCGGGDCGTRT